MLALKSVVMRSTCQRRVVGDARRMATTISGWTRVNCLLSSSPSKCRKGNSYNYSTDTTNIDNDSIISNNDSCGNGNDVDASDCITDSNINVVHSNRSSNNTSIIDNPNVAVDNSNISDCGDVTPNTQGTTTPKKKTLSTELKRASRIDPRTNSQVVVKRLRKVLLALHREPQEVDEHDKGISVEHLTRFGMALSAFMKKEMMSFDVETYTLGMMFLMKTQMPIVDGRLLWSFDQRFEHETPSTIQPIVFPTFIEASSLFAQMGIHIPMFFSALDDALDHHGDCDSLSTHEVVTSAHMLGIAMPKLSAATADGGGGDEEGNVSTVATVLPEALPAHAKYHWLLDRISSAKVIQGYVWTAAFIDVENSTDKEKPASSESIRQLAQLCETEYTRDPSVFSLPHLCEILDTLTRLRVGSKLFGVVNTDSERLLLGAKDTDITFLVLLMVDSPMTTREEKRDLLKFVDKHADIIVKSLGRAAPSYRLLQLSSCLQRYKVRSPNFREALLKHLQEKLYSGSVPQYSRTLEHLGEAYSRMRKLEDDGESKSTHT
eukprot:m.66226 g.66226  ORF g.66226 m.66226 type:complete len:548 (+) comp23661_c0_seq2:171-1814(+)